MYFYQLKLIKQGTINRTFNKRFNKIYSRFI